MNKKALIFGVTGQDGSHLADLLLSKGYHVIGVSRRTSTDNKSRVSHLLNNKNFEIVECDITDAHSVYWTLDKYDDVDEIYNLAAQSFVGVSFKQPGATWDATAKGCLNILQSMVDLRLSARFYQASSSEMFGSAYTLQHCDYDTVDLDLTTDTGKHYIEEHSKDPEYLFYQDERTKFLPQSPYAIAKCAAHYMTRLYREAYGIHASCGILFNHEGPRRGEQFVTRKITKWIGDFHRWCYKQNVFPSGVHSSNIDDVLFDPNNPNTRFPKLRLGNIHASRDWGYAGDFCEAMWMMLQMPHPDDYVICTGETHTIEEFLEAAFSRMGLDWKNYVMIDHDLYRPAEVDFLKGNNKKAVQVLGWTPKHSFSDLVDLMLEGDLSEKKL
jgi:GDPmannose 4,6-dehydratase